MSEEELSIAVDQMRDFAERTGLTSGAEGPRYLWTDAVAVCNFVGLARETGKERLFAWAEQLVDRVHRRLGKHRGDDEREGWLSGLSGDEAERHPTRGGLRIGKPRPERPRGREMDREGEWDRDGQYFHYNTKWMQALDVLSRATGEVRYNRWARELADASHRAFVHAPSEGRRPRMYWKMRVDLSEPLVDTMGQHDPVEGYVTYRQLRASARDLGAREGPELDEAVADFEQMASSGRWATEDPLGLGGLLLNANREAWILDRDGGDDLSTLGDLLEAARRGLRRFARRPQLDGPADERLAFRELGLAIGLRAASSLEEGATASGLFTPGTIQRRALDAIADQRWVGSEIVDFWSRASHREVSTWREHRDINQVMFASALAPSGCIRLPEID